MNEWKQGRREKRVCAKAEGQSVASGPANLSTAGAEGQRDRGRRNEGQREEGTEERSFPKEEETETPRADCTDPCQAFSLCDVRLCYTQSQFKFFIRAFKCVLKYYTE